MKLSIPLNNVEALQTRFAELVKKAEKLKLPAPALIMGEVYSVERKHSTKDGFLLPHPVLEFYQRIEVVGEGIDKPISYGNYKIVGAFNHEYERVLYSSFAPSITPAPEHIERFKANNVSHCEHCNKTIRRNNTYLIASEDGKQLLVGSSCMKAFVPLGKSVESIVAYYQSVFEQYLDDELFDEGYSCDSWNRFESVVGHLVRVMIIRKHTTVSPSDKEGMTAMMMAVNEPGFYQEFGVTREDITRCREMVGEVIAWWSERDITDPLQFDYKIQTIVASDRMRARDAAVASWAVHKWIDATAVNVVEGENKFLGEVGERLNNIEVVLERDQYLYANEYGVTYLYIFKTPEGNTITWKTTPRDINQGDRLLISGRVKEHSEFKGINQTVITRPTLREI